jgi:hypothetical protein
VKNDLNMTNDKHVRQESDIYHRDRWPGHCYQI